MSMMDNSAIERIATPGLSDDALALLETHGTNDDVVFFLGRLVWQGQMVDCVPVLARIAGDPSRGRYARIAAIRGVMTVGDAGEKNAVWEKFADDPSPLDHAMLAELIDGTSPPYPASNCCFARSSMPPPMSGSTSVGSTKLFTDSSIACQGAPLRRCEICACRRSRSVPDTARPRRQNARRWQSGPCRCRFPPRCWWPTGC